MGVWGAIAILKDYVLVIEINSILVHYILFSTIILCLNAKQSVIIKGQPRIIWSWCIYMLVYLCRHVSYWQWFSIHSSCIMVVLVFYHIPSNSVIKRATCYFWLVTQSHVLMHARERDLLLFVIKISFNDYLQFFPFFPLPKPLVNFCLLRC